MKTFFNIYRNTSLKVALIYIFDNSMNLLSKIAYFLTIYKKSVDSSIFSIIKNADKLNLTFRTEKDIHEITFELKSFQNIVLLRKGTSDAAVFKEIFIDSEYQLIIDEINKNNIEINNIIDIGSNIGMSILYFSIHFHNAPIIGIEPDSSNFSMLENNIKANMLQNVIIEKSALWPNKTSLKITSNFRQGGKWSLGVEEDKNNGNVNGITMDSIIQTNNFKSIGLLKIDIEGSEKLIFKNTEECKFLAFTKSICIEAHHEVNSLGTIASTLAFYGFELFFNGEVIYGINRKLI